MTTSHLTHAIAFAEPTAAPLPAARYPVNWSAKLGINNVSIRRPGYTFDLTYGNGANFNYRFTADRTIWNVWTNNERVSNLNNVAKTYKPGDGFSDGDDKRSIASPRGGTVTLNAGAGNDFIFVANQGTALNATMGDGMDFALGGVLNDSIRGGAGDDVLLGAAGDDTLNGEAGKDVIDGGDGNDRLRGGADNDRIRGGSGNDTIFGDKGSDALYGDAGADIFVFDHDHYTTGTIDQDTIFDFQANDKINLKSLSERFRPGLQQRLSISNDGGFAKLSVNLDNARGADLTILVKGMSYAEFFKGQNNFIQF